MKFGHEKLKDGDLCVARMKPQYNEINVAMVVSMKGKLYDTEAFKDSEKWLWDITEYVKDYGKTGINVREVWEESD